MNCALAGRPARLLNDDLSVLALFRISHDVVDKGVGARLVEGHFHEAALCWEKVNGLRTRILGIVQKVRTFLVDGIEDLAHDVEA